MKIGIITFWRSNDNYGQLLQCWALQQYLKIMGFEPYLIRYDYNPVPNGLWWKRIVKLFLVFPAIVKIFRIRKKRIYTQKLTELNKRNRLRRFDEFRNNNLNMCSQVYHNLKELRKCPPEADCYMTGSDQTWAQLVDIKNNWAYFLSFGQEEIPRIAYAPSFARNNYPQKIVPQLNKLLSKYSAISVREKDGVEICRKAGYTADHVLDPTFLLSKDDYISLLELRHNPTNQFFLYSMNVENPDEIRWKELKMFAKDCKKNIICTMGSGLCPGFEIYDEVEYKYPKIKEWIEEIWNSDLVITSSFHGVVFSIIMQTPFIFIPLTGIRGKGNGRIFELLEFLKLSDRILSPSKEYVDLLKQNINWQMINVRLQKEIDKSKAFLYRSCVNK